MTPTTTTTTTTTSSAAAAALPSSSPSPSPPLFLSSPPPPPSSSSSPEWPLKAVSLLLDTYLQKFSDGRGFLRGSDWEDVRSMVNTQCDGLKSLKTVKQCKDKIDSLKRRYKSEKRRAVNGNAVTWPFFAKLDKLMGSVFKQGLAGFSDECFGATNGRYSETAEPRTGLKARPNGREDLNHSSSSRTDERGGSISASEDGFFSLLHSQAPLKLLTLTGAAQLSSDSGFMPGGMAGQQQHSRPSSSSLLQCEPGQHHPLLEAWKPAGNQPVMHCEPGHPLLESWKPAGQPLMEPWKPSGHHSMQCEAGLPGAWKPLASALLHPPQGIDPWMQHEPDPAPPPKSECKPLHDPESGSGSEPDPDPEPEPEPDPDGPPMQALVDALAGFSEVYARVEIAKMEIFTSLKLRLAKLKRKRHRKRAKKVHSSG